LGKLETQERDDTGKKKKSKMEDKDGRRLMRRCELRKTLSIMKGYGTKMAS